MRINSNNIGQWKADIERSVDHYNQWFLSFAPPTFRSARAKAVKDVRKFFRLSHDCNHLTVAFLISHPFTLKIIRQMLCPPISRDRLSGLAGVTPAVVKRLEDCTNGGIGFDKKIAAAPIKIIEVVNRLMDKDLLPWVGRGKAPTSVQRSRAAMIIADRLCGALSDPILRNAQEKRQLDAIGAFLTSMGYRRKSPSSYKEMRPGDFAFHLNVAAKLEDGVDRFVNIPVDVAIQPKAASAGQFPIIIEAKSAGDFANVNKRRKEEAQKIRQLKLTYGDSVQFLLFLCGYFDGGYLGYEATEGIDWIWEHRIEDMRKLGL